MPARSEETLTGPGYSETSSTIPCLAQRGRGKWLHSYRNEGDEDVTLSNLERRQNSQEWPRLRSVGERFHKPPTAKQQEEAKHIL